MYKILKDIPPSKRARKARMRKGELLPTNSYITLPKGAPTKKTCNVKICHFRVI